MTVYELPSIASLNFTFFSFFKNNRRLLKMKIFFSLWAVFALVGSATASSPTTSFQQFRKTFGAPPSQVQQSQLESPRTREFAGDHAGREQARQHAPDFVAFSYRGLIETPATSEGKIDFTSIWFSENKNFLKIQYRTLVIHGLI